MRLQTSTALPPRMIRLLLAMAFAASLMAATMATAVPSFAFGGDGLRAAANGYRATESVAPVAGTPLLDDIATKRAAQMVASGKLEHDMDYVFNRLQQSGVCWKGVGEIIAWDSRPEYDYDRTMLQWWNSATHHEILMSAGYNAAGAAWATAEDGGHYSVMVFVTLCGSDVSQVAYNGTPFTDIAGSIFRDDIAWLYNAGITSGCTATQYCPTASATRAQMASFLDRILELPATTRDYFSDDNGSVHEDAIDRLAAAGITTGCSAGRYCPGGSVTRGQMASFLARALHLTDGSGSNAFDDDNGNVHEFDIDRLAYEAVTTGCATRRYCPSGAVTRGQMAAFLRRAFGS
jgi:hypothetical protein